MTTKGKLIVIFVLAAFLIGFLPPYLQKRGIDKELQATSKRVMSLELDLRLAELRDLCGMMLLEVLRQNFGLAREHSTKYFEQVGQVVEQIQDPSAGQSLRDLLGKRDSITALFAQSDPASSSETQLLCRRTYEVTGK